MITAWHSIPEERIRCRSMDVSQVERGKPLHSGPEEGRFCALPSDEGVGMRVSPKLRRLAVAVLVTSLAAAVSFAPAASAATYARVWTLTSPSTSPPARAGHAMAYDPVSKQVLVFGGYDDPGYRNDTWTWDGSTWTKQAPATSPAPRAGSGIAFDRVTRQLVMFGGFSGSGYLGDTWTWDGSISSWTRRNTPTRPPKVSGPMLF